MPAAIHKLDFICPITFVNMHDCSNITTIEPFMGRFTIEHDEGMFGNHGSSSGYAVTSRGGRSASTIHTASTPAKQWDSRPMRPFTTYFAPKGVRTVANCSHVAARAKRSTASSCQRSPRLRLVLASGWKKAQRWRRAARDHARTDPLHSIASPLHRLVRPAARQSPVLQLSSSPSPSR